MTPEEAIKTIQAAIAEVEWEYLLDYSVAFETALNALEKQIPKKVTKSACPSCNRIFLFRHSEKRKGDYCDNCGQALDWSDDNGRQRTTD